MNKLKLLGVSLSAALTLGLSASPAHAVEYKTCYLTMPTTWTINSYASKSEGSAYYSNWTDYLSGDCPSTTVLPLGTNPLNNMELKSYSSGGVDFGYSGMTYMMMSGNMGDFPGFVDNWGTEQNTWYLYASGSGTDANGEQIRTLEMVSDAPDGHPYYAVGTVNLPAPAKKYENVWTGNLPTTPECGDYNIDTCPGGYTYENYKLVTVNPLTWKYASPFAATVKKSGKALTFKVSMNRAPVMDVYDSEFSGVFAFREDSVKVYRDGKLIKSKVFTKLGTSKIKLNDKRGKQEYKVCIAETSRAWSNCTTFIK